jgi:histidyl-tRNA synthetase
MHDILPEEMPRWHFLEERYREIVERFGYQEIRTPVLEPLELFVRGIGEDTDIVEKEMYSFEDKGGARLALRPEGTASAMRAYMQHNLGGLEPVSKLYYLGPMFRRERPAKGRYRQFYQAGAELVGAAEPTADAEIIGMAVMFVESLGIHDVSVQINSLGDRDTRPAYRGALVDHFGPFAEGLCGDCRRRLETNPLRVLDCKVESCRGIASGAPSVLEYLGSEAREHFDELKRLLDRSGVRYSVVPKMVRGLDYYSRTIFEIQGRSEDLGAQATIVGGGRYDDLLEQLGGKRVPTIGFAFGIERLLMMLGDEAQEALRTTVFVVAAGAGGQDRAIELTWRLRREGFKVEASYAEGSLRSQLKRADRVKASVALIAGEDEAARGAVTLRDMKAGTQEEVPLSELHRRIEAIE